MDLDGTVYRGESLIDGAAERIAVLREEGARVVFLSNKPLEPRRNYAAKLTRLGVPTAPEDVVNSTQATFHYLRSIGLRDELYVVGEQALLEEFRAEGFGLQDDPARIQAVIAAFDRTLDYAKLNTAYQALKRGARFFATNADRSCPVDEGDIPDCAGVIAFLEATSGRQVEMVAGKPSPDILQAALARLQLDAHDCLMVGDRLATDICMGNTCQLDTALVLSGVTALGDLVDSPYQPTWVLESIASLP